MYRRSDAPTLRRTDAPTLRRSDAPTLRRTDAPTLHLDSVDVTKDTRNPVPTYHQRTTDVPPTLIRSDVPTLRCSYAPMLLRPDVPTLRCSYAPTYHRVAASTRVGTTSLCVAHMCVFVPLILWCHIYLLSLCKNNSPVESVDATKDTRAPVPTYTDVPMCTDAPELHLWRVLMQQKTHGLLYLRTDTPTYHRCVFSTPVPDHRTCIL